MYRMDMIRYMTRILGISRVHRSCKLQDGPCHAESVQVTLQGSREAQRIAGMLGMIRIEWLGGAGHVMTI